MIYEVIAIISLFLYALSILCIIRPKTFKRRKRKKMKNLAKTLAHDIKTHILKREKATQTVQPKKTQPQKKVIKEEIIRRTPEYED